MTEKSTFKDERYQQNEKTAKGQSLGLTIVFLQVLMVISLVKDSPAWLGFLAPQLWACGIILWGKYKLDGAKPYVYVACVMVALSILLATKFVMEL